MSNFLDTWARNDLGVFNNLDISQVSAAEYKLILHRPFLNSPASRTWALPFKI